MAALSYDSEILHYARLAQAHGASIFYVGTELDSASLCTVGGTTTISCADRWHHLIAAVRAVFTGKIVYAASDVPANFPLRGYQVYPAWDAVDLIGVDSYFQLDLPRGKGGVPDPGVPALVSAWHSFTNRIRVAHPAYDDLNGLATQYNKPVFASEVGYSSGDYSTFSRAATALTAAIPSTGGQSCTDGVNTQAQTDAYEAYFETFAGAPWYDGMVIWDYQIDEPPSTSAIQVDTRGKPVEPLISSWWKATSTSTTSSTTTTANTTSTTTSTTTSSTSSTTASRPSAPALSASR